ncbi:MAG: ATP-binding protein [Methylomonas sp.]|nr:ATP-binding protein [Methylomonas sp.]PPD21713.1 MAG: ABC transporter [Methylomonas sp.]
MKISAIYTKGVGPLADGVITFENDWTEELESKILLTGPNGCGKSTVLRLIAMLWDAAGHWLTQGSVLPQKHEARIWLQRWDGVAVVLDAIQPFYNQPIGLVFGPHDWVEETLHENHKEVSWFGEVVARSSKPGKPRRDLYLTNSIQEQLLEWSEWRKRLILTHDKVDAPNLIYLDAEERSWVAPKRRVSEPLPDPLTQRWLTKYAVTEDWQGQLEASLINLKTTQLHKYHDVIRDLNQFLVGKEIDPDIKPGEGRLRVKLKNQRGANHSLDELSAGEHQILILIYLISRWMQPGGVVLIDEPDLYLHPSLISSLLASIEQLVQGRNGQLIITSHAVDVWHRYENQGKRIELKTRGES